MSKAFPAHPGTSRLLRLARLAVALVMALCAALYVAGMAAWPGYVARHPDAILPFDWTPAQMDLFLGRFGISLQAWIATKLLLGFLAAAGYYLVGWVIFLRRGRDGFGLYLAAGLALYGTLTSDQVFILQFIQPALSQFLQYASVLSWANWFFLFYLFPDGKFSPGWGRAFAALLVVFFLVDILVFQGSSPPPWLAAGALVPMAGAVFSQAHRWRVSGPVERQQIKWVLFSILLLLITLMVGMLAAVFPQWTRVDQPYSLWLLIFIQLSSLLLISFPAAIGFAILRYRLWDIDILIRRTLVYSILTGVLALTYFGAVTLLQSLFSGLSGQQTPAALVISTLLTAALVSPLRRRIQEAINRRFYRQKYDAERALAEFAAAARKETDLETLKSKLALVARENLQPVKLSIWLPPVEKPGE